jgi:acetyltransferase-like isoleucine patch superfamily enzyme
MLKNPLTLRLLRYVDNALKFIHKQDRLESLYKQAFIEPNVTLAPTATFENHQGNLNAIHIGAHSVIHGQLLVFRHGGTIRLGSYVFLGPGSRIWSSTSVIIGNHVLISHNVNIHDNDSHPFDTEARHEQVKFILDHSALPTTSCGTAEAPVFIEDDVWIGLNATILKGVSIGRGAIVAAGAVVTHDVEAFTLVAGNPATLKKKLNKHN